MHAVLDAIHVVWQRFILSVFCGLAIAAMAHAVEMTAKESGSGKTIPHAKSTDEKVDDEGKLDPSKVTVVETKEKNDGKSNTVLHANIKCGGVLKGAYVAGEYQTGANVRDARKFKVIGKEANVGSIAQIVMENASDNDTAHSQKSTLLYAAVVGDVNTEGVKQERDPKMLDLSKFYMEANEAFSQIAAFSGRQVIGGLPFQVDGQVRLYGKTPEAHREGAYPDTKKGIQVDRKFDELYLIHHTTWPDVEGETVAYVCLNYANGDKYVFPIRYGYQVRDWYNLPSYEKEAVADPDTMICWRRSPAAFKAPIRIFLSKLANPSPDKVVETIDVISSRHQAAYNLLAATVANRCANEKEEFVGDRKFDRKMTIKVVDDETDKPIEGALVLPGMVVQDEGVVGTPFYTSSSGEGVIPYPSKETRHIFASVEKEGYQTKGESWGRRFPDGYTFRLTPREQK